MAESTVCPPFRLVESRFDQVNINRTQSIYECETFVFLFLVDLFRLTADGVDYGDRILQVNCLRGIKFCCSNELPFTFTR